MGYDRDNWSFNSSGARARLGCSSSEHVDHIVALKEAYDSGAAAWSSTRKAGFANDPANLWCLDASVNRSKLDGDLAEWAGGSCAQRKHIATVTQQVKSVPTGCRPVARNSARSPRRWPLSARR